MKHWAAYQRWRATAEEDHNSIVAQELYSRIELNMSVRLGLELFSATRVLVHEVKGNYEIPLLSIALSWYNHCYYFYELYIDNLLNREVNKVRDKNSD